MCSLIFFLNGIVFRYLVEKDYRKKIITSELIFFNWLDHDIYLMVFFPLFQKISFLRLFFLNGERL